MLSLVASAEPVDKANLVGFWQYQGAGKDLSRVSSPDDAVFAFKSDGSLQYIIKDLGVDESGEYELDGSSIRTVLEMFPGTYEVVSMDKRKMVWKSGIYYHFFQKQ